MLTGDMNGGDGISDIAVEWWGSRIEMEWK